MSLDDDKPLEVQKTDAEWKARLDPVRYDGPGPAGERFRIDSAAIDFEAQP